MDAGYFGKSDIGLMKEDIFSMNGEFRDLAREYEIRNMYPIRPLINYMWNEEYVLSVDHMGQGHGFASIGNGMRRSVVMPDEGSRLIYVKDDESGEFCCMNKSFGEDKLEEYSCCIGIGYQDIIGKYKDVRCKFSMTVPINGRAELWKIDLENTSSKSKKIAVYVHAKILANETGHTSYNISDWIDKVGGLYFSHIAYGAQHPYGGVYLCADEKPASYCTSEARFRGLYNTYQNPIGINTLSLDNKGSSYDDSTVAVLQFRLELGANEKKAIHIVVGLSRDSEHASKEAEYYLNEFTFEKNIEQRKKDFDQIETAYQLDSGNKYLDRMVNVWLKNQIQLGKTWARVYGKGVRDILQDVTSFVSMDTDIAREKIVECLEHQFSDGNTIRMWDPVLAHPYVDGAVWIIDTVVQYIKESGNINFLNEDVFFYESSEKGSVLEHMRRGIDFLTNNLGEHGLCLWKGGDWNDSINNAGMQGIGESVWLSIATVRACKIYSEILYKININDEADIVAANAEKMTESIMKYGYDSGYFIYGINDWGEKIGANECNEGKIYLNPQSWAVLAGIVKDEDSKKLLNIVDEKLHCDYGYVQCAPSYTKLDNHIGRASGFVPGCVENGSVYNHGVTFKIAADCVAGRADIAYRTLKEIMPDNPILENSGVEPYAMTNMYLGPDNPYNATFAPCSWITGTAGWMYRCITEYIFGIQAEFDGLKIAPCLSTELDNVKIVRRFRGAEYHILLQHGKESSIVCDGVLMKNNILPVFEAGTSHNIKVVVK